MISLRAIFGANHFFQTPKMLIYANKRENDAADLIFFSPKEAQLLFRQLQKLSARNIAALKCESRKTKCLVPWYPLMQLSANMYLIMFNKIILKS